MTRAALMIAYLALAIAALWVDRIPHLFWTVMLPLLPVAIVALGFYRWRRLCPLAGFGALGAQRGRQRRVPEWLDDAYLPVTFGLLLTMLALRHLATNGDGVWLGGLLLALAAAAALTNALTTGKTWCNLICPVGFVERAYTEPVSLRDEDETSRCEQCTACKRACPDIDQESAYWNDAASRGRWLTMTAFPGLVLGFYAYFWFRHGTWDAYFGGGWTDLPANTELALGPGFFFAPTVPALVAAPLTLVLFSAASAAVFAGLEGLLLRLRAPAEDLLGRVRHEVLTIAAASAFLLFYAFAGAPGLGAMAGGTRALTLVAAVAATLMVVRRWPRTRVAYLQDRGVTKLVRRWRYDEPPPETADGVMTFVRVHEQARADQVSAYRAAITEVVADGVVSMEERAVLDRVRDRLSIGDKTQRTLLASLETGARDALEAAPLSLERRLQLEGYERALSAALSTGASPTALESLRADWAVSEEDHAHLRHRLERPDQARHELARRELELLATVRQDLQAVGSLPERPVTGLLRKVLLQRQERVLDRVREALAGAAAPPDVAEALDDARSHPMPEPGAGHHDVLTLIAHLSEAGDAWLRLGALRLAADLSHEELELLVQRGLEDAQPIVREQAEALRDGEPPAEVPESFEALTTLDRILQLSAVPLFAELGPDALHDLATRAVEVTVPADAPICRQGERGGSLYVLVGGSASRGRDGDRRPIAVGATAGGLAVLDESPQPSDVVAGPQGARLVALPAEHCRAVLSDPAHAPHVIVALARRLRAQAEGSG